MIFTGVDSQKGYWRGIKFDSQNPLNELIYTKISYRGSVNWSYIDEPANISLRNTQLTLTDCEIQFSVGYGVWAVGGTDADITVSGTYYSNNDAGDNNY